MKNQATKNQPANVPYLSLIMGGALAMSQSTTLAQTPPPLIDGLPPSPPVPGNDSYFDTDTNLLPPVPDIKDVPDSSSSNTPVTTITPANDSSTPAINIPVSDRTSNNQPSLSGRGWYRVDVFGDSSRVLAKVQKVEPKAFIRSGEGVIQVGIFSEPINAQKLRSQLEAEGLRTQVIGINSTTTKPSSISLPSRYSQKKGYFVIIPSSKKRINAVFNQVLDSGIDKTYISLQDNRQGNHIGIGPFQHRTEAQRWNAYFRSIGMDARVYFGK